MTGPFQGTERFADEYFDQHGRGWKYSVTTVSRDRNSPDSLTQDRNGYGSAIDCNPPWRLPEQYIYTLAKVKGQNRIHNDYSGYIESHRGEYTKWHTHGVNLQRQASKSQYVVGMDLSADVRQVLGPSPEPWQIAAAARDSKPGSAVHQWLIWGVGVMPPQLAQYFPAKAEEMARESGAPSEWDDEPTGENLGAIERATVKKSHHKQREPAAALEE